MSLGRVCGASAAVARSTNSRSTTNGRSAPSPTATATVTVPGELHGRTDGPLAAGAAEVINPSTQITFAEKAILNLMGSPVCTSTCYCLLSK